MASLEAQILESQRQVAETQRQIAELGTRFEQAAASDQAVQPSIDIANATLADVNKNTEVMNANIAELIMGLDDITAGFSKDFEEMRGKTAWENVVGVFARGKSEAMRQERLRAASIDDKLQDLISKSDVITRLLQGQLDLLNEQKAKVEANLTQTLAEREATVDTLEGLREQIRARDPRLIELENRVAATTDPSDRTRLETELANANRQHNALVQDEQVALARSQTLERYIEAGKTWVEETPFSAANPDDTEVFELRKNTDASPVVPDDALKTIELPSLWYGVAVEMSTLVDEWAALSDGPERIAVITQWLAQNLGGDSST